MSSSSLLSYYSRRAAEYEAIYAKPERQADLSALRNLVAQRAKGRVLELACGTGYWTAVLVESAEQVLATDKSKEVLEIATSKRLPTQKVKFMVADAYEVPARPGQFDTVFAGFWWSHVPRQEMSAYLAKLAAAVGPGITVLFVDNRYVEGSSTSISRTDEFGNTYQLRKLGDGSEFEVLKNFPTAAELRSAIVSSGDDPQVTELQYYWLLQYVTRQPALPADAASPAAEARPWAVD